MTNRTCQRCSTTCSHGSRRFACKGCNRKVCSKCCNRGGSGQGQGSTRWAECHDCQAKREFPNGKTKAGTPRKHPQTSTQST